MRLFRIRGGLEYYRRSELGDESALAERLIGGGWGLHPPPAADLVGALAGAATGGSRVKFIDLVVAAPKSVSIAYALGTPAVREQVVGAHLGAVEAAISLIERIDLAAEGRDGRLEGGGLRGVQFLHQLSRELDPHLHSHVVVANRISAFGGERAIDHWRMSRTLPAYELAYRSELKQRLLPAGIALQGEGLGRLEVEGQDSELVRTFSSRRLQVLSSARSASPRSRQLAALETRRERVSISQPELDRLWRAKARTAPPGWPRDEPPVQLRIPDPFLAELAKQLSRFETGVEGALSKTLAALFPPEVAAAVERGLPTRIGDERLKLDGSLARAYRRIPLERRLAMAGADLDRVHLLPARSTSAAAVLDAIAAAGHGRPLKLIGRSQREEEYLRSLGQIPAFGRGLDVLVDAGSMPASDIAAVSRSTEMAVIAPGHGSCRQPSPVVEVTAARGSLFVSERPVDAWGAFVKEATASLQSGSDRQFVVDSVGLVNRLRGEIAASHPELVVGSVGSRPFFRGERVAGPGSRLGRVISITNAVVEIEDSSGAWSVPASRLEFASIGARSATTPAPAVSYYGSRRPPLAGSLSVYLSAPRSGALDLLAGGSSRVIVDDAAVQKISGYRLRALALGGGRVTGPAALPFYRARTAEQEVIRLFQRVHQLGMDDRSGHDRVLDAYLGRERKTGGGEGRTRELPGLALATAVSWHAWLDADALSW